MITYIVDTRTGEVDILSNLKQGSLVIRALDGVELYRQQAPQEGWTFEELSAIQPEGVQNGADAFLDEQWVGSTEV